MSGVAAPETVRVERDSAWWAHVAQHPAVAPLMGALSIEQLASIVASPRVLPLAADHGGFIFASIDSFSRVLELHTLFTPEGWGREVHRAAKAAFCRVFDAGADMVITHEVDGNSHSQPPRSFGFRPMGEMAPSPLGDVRTWLLTQQAWRDSPGRRSLCH